jgi:hypothetical protein|tara:strand:- start:659 stop:1234 length:576 start_codon:yes stop_codon:yes gene_type:complete
MASFETDVLRGPIPGQSLTTEPGGRPWEQPPQFVHAEDALKYYIDSLIVPQKASSLVSILRRGYPVVTLVDSIIVAGTMKGLHTLDVGVLIAPALFTFITGLADILEVEYKTGMEASNRPSKTVVEQAIREGKQDVQKNADRERHDQVLEQEARRALTTVDVTPAMEERSEEMPVTDRGLMQRPMMEQGEI